MIYTEQVKNFATPFDLVDFIDFIYVPKFKDKEFLHEMYVKKKKTLDEIAVEICSSRSTVLKYLQEFGIPTREKSKPKTSTKTSYGYKIKEFKKVSVPHELMRVEDMRKLQEQGYSYRKIAEILNALSVPTKSGKSTWCGKGVYQVLNPNLSNS